MTKNELIEALAEHFDIELIEKENGEYDISGYDWTAGCYSNGIWMSLAEVVKALKYLCEE